MNVMKFAGTNGRYLIAAPYCDSRRDGWLVLEEGRDGLVFRYQYIPNFSEKVRCYIDGKNHLYLYGSRTLYIRHCYIKYIPSWAVAGSTI
jgi:hypothetical protein